MSLIEEALRRVQDPIVSGKKAAPQAPSKESKQAERETPREPAPAHSWSPTPQPAALARIPATTAPHTTQALMVVAFTILAFTATLIAGGFFWMSRTPRQRSPAAPAPLIAATPAAAPAPAETRPPAAEPAPQPIGDTLKAAVASLRLSAPPKQDDLQLTGIVEGIGEPYAVINGGIIAIGEKIGRFTLVNIHNGAAILRRDDGTDTILRVAR